MIMVELFKLRQEAVIFFLQRPDALVVHFFHVVGVGQIVH